MKGTRRRRRKRGRRGEREGTSVQNQSKKSIFNLAVRMVKLAFQQHWHGLNYTNAWRIGGREQGRKGGCERGGYQGHK